MGSDQLIGPSVGNQVTLLEFGFPDSNVSLLVKQGIINLRFAGETGHVQGM